MDKKQKICKALGIKKFTDEVKKRYFKYPFECPFCKGAVEGEMVDVDSGTCTQKVHCPECEVSWEDRYILDDVRLLK